jgi:hypothetical protein
VRLEGSERVAAPPETTFARLTDPDVLRRCVPGLEKLDAQGEGRYAAALEVKLAAIHGRFTGEVAFTERRPPEHLRVRLDGKGAPGFVRADVALALSPAEGGTLVRYDADVQIGGQIARLGQRMISGIAKEMAGQLFEALARMDLAPAAASRPPSPLLAALRLLWGALLRMLGLRRR